MRRFVSPSLLVLVLTLRGASGNSNPHPSHPQSAYEDLSRIIGSALLAGGGYAFLETLTDRVGGRITGSPESREASELILSALHEAGYGDAHFENYVVQSSWQHGVIRGEVVSPVRRGLYVGSYGWVPGTPGPIEVPLVDLGEASDGRAALRQPVRGAAILVDLASSVSSTTYVGVRALLARQLAQAGARAMLLVSDKPNRMLYTSAFLFYPHAPLPVISIASEDAALLRRLLAHGAVRLRLDVQNSFAGPTEERNVVAELAGSDPAEMVLVTAHFDSWDAAQGANDNGAGVAAVLEAARVLKSLDIHPRHTIRFVFFSGEEQSDLGSRAYVEQHRQELDRIRAVFNTDAGAQAPVGFKLYGREDLKEPAGKLLSALAGLGADRLFMDADFDSDEESFMVVGVPAYSLAVEPGDYHVRHHTIVDTLEKIDRRLLGMQAAILAAAAYQFSSAEERPGRRLRPAEVHELLEKTGLEALYELDYPDKKPY
jgi:carboxypeptidase Q